MKWLVVVLVMLCVEIGEAATVLQFARTSAAVATEVGTQTPIKAAVDTVVGAASRWGVSTIPWSRMANVAGWVSVGYGVMQATRQPVVDYLSQKALGVNEQGQVTKAGSMPDGVPSTAVFWLKQGTTAPGMGAMAANYSSSESFSVGSMFRTQADALAAGYNGAYGHSACLGWDTTYWGSMGKQTEWGAHTSYSIAFWPKSGNTAELVDASTLVQVVPANVSEIVTKFLEDIATSTAHTAAAQNAALKLLQQIDADLNAELSGQKAPNSQSESIKEELKSGLSAADIAALTAANEPQGYADQKNAQQNTKEAVKDAVNEAAQEGFGGGPTDLPPEQPPGPPEKQNLSSILAAFFSSISTLPIVSWLSGFHFTLGSESSVICLPVGSTLGGGSICVDFSEHSGVLDFMGNALLTLVAFQWTMWLFRGRNDG